MAVGKLRSMSFGSKTPASRNPSPTMPGGPSAKRITRSSNVPLTSLEIEAQPSTVTDAASAHIYLKKKSLCHATEPYTLNHLISVLLQIMQISGATPLPVLTAIRSVVYLLKQHVIDEISEAAAQQITTTVAQQVMESITGKLVDHVIAAIAPQVARILSASETLEETIQKTEQLRTSLDRPDLEEEILTKLTQLAPQILDHIMMAINPQIEQLALTSNSLSISLEGATKIHQAPGEYIDLDRDINAVAARITNATDTIHSAIEDCHDSINRLSPSLETTQDQIHLLSTQLLNQPGPPPPGTSTPALFSNIVTANATGPTTRLHSSRGSPPNVQIYTRQQPQSFDPTSNMQYQIPPIDEALARSAIRARQILLDPIDGNLVFPPSISHDESLDKLRNAIKTALAPNGHDDNRRNDAQTKGQRHLEEVPSSSEFLGHV
ncbi:hypothetical protein F4604DRAFT_1674860 [Suillus subluteus]|nr:hypothetical protein F4604DRAFT_1674860 [Suillus subluteus]